MKSKTENWIKEFDEKFVRDDGLMDKYGFYDNGEEDYLANVIKKFISQLLKSQKQDLIKKLAGQLKKELADARHSIPKGEYKDGYLMGYSDAKETIIDVLELLEEAV